MAPVGSFESLHAAIQGGADAVYFGVGQFNMRARSSQNFSLNDLKEITSICKKNNVKTYVTLNTVIYDNEIESIHEIIDSIAAYNVDAIIASDRAVINYAIKKNIAIHASTQCNICNLEAVKYYARFSEVIVLARELSLKQVSYICKKIKEENIYAPSGNLLRIEAFAHGALCMAVSGKCYISLDNMNYSANRGACLQLCRRKYLVKDFEDEHELLVDGAYIMSPKDLCTIGFIDKLIKAGISVFKIEGRGRSPEYVKTVTRIYKEATTAVINNTYNQKKIQNWLVQLKEVYNRGFWEGYYLGKKTGEWTQKYGSQATTKKEYIGKITNFFSKLNVAEIKIETGQIKNGDKILIIGPTTGVVELIISEIRIALKPITIASKGDICSIPSTELVRRGDKLYKLVVNQSDDSFE